MRWSYLGGYCKGVCLPLKLYQIVYFLIQNKRSSHRIFFFIGLLTASVVFFYLRYFNFHLVIPYIQVFLLNFSWSGHLTYSVVSSLVFLALPNQSVMLRSSRSKSILIKTENTRWSKIVSRGSSMQVTRDNSIAHYSQQTHLTLGLRNYSKDCNNQATKKGKPRSIDFSTRQRTS